MIVWDPSEEDIIQEVLNAEDPEVAPEEELEMVRLHSGQVPHRDKFRFHQIMKVSR